MPGWTAWLVMAHAASPESVALQPVETERILIVVHAEVPHAELSAPCAVAYGSEPIHSYAVTFGCTPPPVNALTTRMSPYESPSVVAFACVSVQKPPVVKLMLWV